MITLLAAIVATISPQTPALPEQSQPAAQEILQKVLETYASAKTYQSTWTYTLRRASSTQEMEIEIKAKAPDRILFRVSVPKGRKLPEGTTVPELLVVLDGRMAWYQNTTERTYFKLQLPREPKYTPLMFFPQLATAGPVRRVADAQAEGKTLMALEADRREGGTLRMEVDAQTYHVYRIVDTSTTAFITTVSTIAVKQETFDGALDDRAFSYKPPRAFKEIQPPPGAGAIFGP